MKRTWFAALAVSACWPVLAVSADRAAIAKATPAGFALLAQVDADLNNDGRKDALVVLKNQQEDREGQLDLKRPLLIFLREKSGALHFMARNDQVVLCKTCGGVMGDPYQGISVKNGFFTVEHYGGSRDRWTLLVTFRHEPKDGHWYLSRYSGEDFDALSSTPDKPVRTWAKTSKDFGRVRFERFDPKSL